MRMVKKEHRDASGSMAAMPTETAWRRRLPPETWDSIVEYLRDDHDALMACSLTSCTLLPSSRRHTFHLVSLHNASRYHSLKAILSKPNYVEQYVRALAVHAYKVPANGEWLLLLSKLDRLAHLKLYRFSFSIPYKLKKDICALISTFIWDPDTASAAQSSSLVMLTEWFARAQWRLRRIAIGQIHSKSTPLIHAQRVVSDAGDSLEHLFLEFADGRNVPAVSLDLRNNARLRTLHLVVPIRRSSTRDTLGDLNPSETILRDLCVTRPLIKFTFCFDLRISILSALPLTHFPEELRAEASSIVALCATMVSELAAKLPCLQGQEEGRGLGSLSRATPDGQCYSSQHLLAPWNS
ncbi:uncharacterized protein B0H18DRAFT_1026471 [Fomitopsis serialis]|uniref:uncharacterized protein n=1 Tax=Fomitopsis serialis TaxID=139415 RepID=UPI002007225D|nr:uncharacterized protein B0H18DRAFT_1026471 [Neoantrodia serialis]KAH9919852.1 hypothetical protein B0H18DRAFT_1026471 [Neoantrodia serialis]